MKSLKEIKKKEKKMLDKIQVFGMYIGKQIYFSEIESIDTLQGVTIQGEIFGDPKNDGSYSIENCQLILRPIEEMTEGEIGKLKSLHGLSTHPNYRKPYYINKFEYLISIGICINEEWHKKGWVKYINELENLS